MAGGRAGESEDSAPHTVCSGLAGSADERVKIKNSVIHCSECNQIARGFDGNVRVETRWQPRQLHHHPMPSTHPLGPSYSLSPASVTRDGSSGAGFKPASRVSAPSAPLPTRESNRQTGVPKSAPATLHETVILENDSVGRLQRDNSED